MDGGHIRVVDRLVGTTIHAFLASLTRRCMINARMAMLEKDYFPKNTVWACLHTLPAGLTYAAVDFNVLRVGVTLNALIYHRVSVLIMLRRLPRIGYKRSLSLH